MRFFEMCKTAPPYSDLAGGQETPTHPPPPRCSCSRGSILQHPTNVACHQMDAAHSKGRHPSSIGPAKDTAGSTPTTNPHIQTPARPSWRERTRGREATEKHLAAKPTSPPGSPPPFCHARSLERSSPPSPSPTSRAWSEDTSVHGEGRGRRRRWQRGARVLPPSRLKGDPRPIILHSTKETS
jgi:hypothetical protein